MTDNDVNTLKRTICAKAICAKAGSNQMEVTKRLVDTAAKYIMECYHEVERELEDIMEADQVLRLDPSINATILNNIDGMRAEKLEENMNIYAELMADQTQPEKDLVRLIITYRYMLKKLTSEIKNKEIIKNEIWEQLESNRDQKEVYQKTGSQREKRRKGEDRLEHDLIPHKLESGQPKTGLAQGPKTSKEGLLFNGGFQKSTKKEALLGKNLKNEGLEKNQNQCR